MTRAHGPTRRQALALGPAALLTAGGLAGCTDDPARPSTPTPSPSPTPVDPDDALRTAAAAREQALLREYDAVLAELPALSGRLQPLRAHHVEHLAALGTTEPPDPSGRPSPAASGAPSATATPEGSAPAAAVPAAADVAAALARLVAAERAAGQGHGQDCLLASRRLAGVLGALSASELSHEVALA